ncbi:MAG: nuclear transport factor 2 family protein [Bacteroidota bacterium]
MRILLFLIFIYACSSPKPDAPPFTPKEAAAVRALLAGPQAYWEDWFAQADSVALNQYSSSAIRINEAGQVDSVGQHQGLILDESNQTLIKLQAVGRDTQHVYTLHRINSHNQPDLAELAIWKRSSDDAERELVFTAPYGKQMPSIEAINSTRNRWMQHCNTHDVERLINEVYAPNSLYYNHKPLVRGRTALIEEYAYMANPEYGLWLEPIHVEAVNEALYIELGQCYGSYGGQYIIVWQRQDSGDWMVLLDSNR